MTVTYQVPGVYIKELPPGSKNIQGVGTSMPAFIGFTERRPANNDKPVFVASLMEYQKKFGGPVDGFYLPYAVLGYFMNGGQSCYVQSLATVAEANEKLSQIAATALISTVDENRQLEIRSKLLGAEAKGITVTIADAVAGAADDEAKVAATTPAAPAPDEFSLTITVPGQPPEEHPRVAASKGTNKVPTLAETVSKSRWIELVKASGSLPRPVNGIYELELPKVGPLVTVKQVEGDVTRREGLGAFEEVAEITMLIFPDLMTLYERSAQEDDDLRMVAGLQQALLIHCDKMKDRFAILDAPPGLDVEQVKRYRQEFLAVDEGIGKYGALYYPWVEIIDPAPRRGATNGSRFKLVPPSGHLAGIYARVDADRGVHKAPANEGVRGAVKLERRLIDSEQALLNPIGVNCIREFPGQGILVWGARTLVPAESEWRYINVRRLFNFIEESIYEGTQWVVFEPNDMDLWERVKRSVTAFLTRVWRSGALLGATPEQAFYVTCDATNNPPEELDAGILNVEIGIAPVKPAEFVVFSFRQIQGGGGGVSE